MIAESEKAQQVKQRYNQFPYPNDKISALEDTLKNKWIMKVINHPLFGHPKILDIGCGTGEISCFLSVYGDVTGIDFSKNAINKAKETQDRLKIKNIDFLIEDITKPSLNNKFDYLFCIGVLHHIPEIDLALENIKKFMHINSYLIISVGNKYAAWRDRNKRKRIVNENYNREIDLKNHPYSVEYSKMEFKKILKSHDFKIIKIWRNIPDVIRLITGKGELVNFCCKLDQSKNVNK